MPQLCNADHNINYQIAGPDLGSGGLPVAMIHGLGANLAFWYLGVVRHMTDERPLILHDLRGHGASGMPLRDYRLVDLAKDLNALLGQLGADKVHLVGHSHGARVALAYALAYPDRVASLTIADTQIHALQEPMRLRDWPHWPRWKADLAAQGVTTFPDEDREIDFQLLSELGPRGGGGLGGGGSVRNGPRFPRLAAAAAASGKGGDLVAAGPLARRAIAPRAGINMRSRQMGARGAAQWQDLLSKTSAGNELHDESGLCMDALAELDVPALLMYGETTHCLPTSERLLELLPQARRVIVPGAGHFFPIVKPRFFARTLRVFFAGVESDEPAPSYDSRRLAARARRPLLRVRQGVAAVQAAAAATAKTAVTRA